MSFLPAQIFMVKNFYRILNVDFRECLREIKIKNNKTVKEEKKIDKKIYHRIIEHGGKWVTRWNR